MPDEARNESLYQPILTPAGSPGKGIAAPGCGFYRWERLGGKECGLVRVENLVALEERRLHSGCAPSRQSVDASPSAMLSRPKIEARESARRSRRESMVRSLAIMFPGGLLLVRGLHL
jgi:hypothetical protein